MTAKWLERKRSRVLDVSGQRIRTHERFDPDLLSGCMYLEMRTPKGKFVHPGSGCLEAREIPGTRTLQIAAGAARQAGKPVIPGSGLKGAVRSVVEYLTGGCDPLERKSHNLLRACKAPNGSRKPRGGSREESRNTLCVACHLFGAMGFAGRANFADTHIDDGNAIRERVERVDIGFPPRGNRSGAIKIYDGRGLDDARPWENRVAYSGCFYARLDFTNLESAELGLLLAALGVGQSPLDERFGFRLGGAKYAGQGVVRVRPCSLTWFDSIRPGKSEPELAARCEAFAQAAFERYQTRSHDFRKKLGDLARYWRLEKTT